MLAQIVFFHNEVLLWSKCELEYSLSQVYGTSAKRNVRNFRETRPPIHLKYVFQAMITDLLHEQPKFAEMTDLGNQLTTEPCVGLEERVRLQKEMQSLHERWDGLYGSATSRHDR